jgi:hypothetical protein
MAARTRSAQASKGLGVGDGLAVGDGVGEGVGLGEGEPQAELTAITTRRMATKGPRCPFDEFSMAWVST